MAIGDPVASAIEFTIYEGVGHDSWTATYDNGDVWKWMLEQRLK